MVASYADKHGLVEEHLREHLDDGWRVIQLHGIGGAAEAIHVRGWFVVLLER